MPQSPTYRTRIEHTTQTDRVEKPSPFFSLFLIPCRSSLTLCTHRAHVAFTVNVRSAWQARNERGYEGSEGRVEQGEPWSLHAPVTATPVGYRRHKPPCKITLCPGLDRKLLFVRRLRGEFSDNETRSFRTRYGFGSRYQREGVATRPSLPRPSSFQVTLTR